MGIWQGINILDKILHYPIGYIRTSWHCPSWEQWSAELESREGLAESRLSNIHWKSRSQTWHTFWNTLPVQHALPSPYAARHWLDWSRTPAVSLFLLSCHSSSLSPAEKWAKSSFVKSWLLAQWDNIHSTFKYNESAVDMHRCQHDCTGYYSCG